MRIALCWSNSAIVGAAFVLGSCANDNLPSPQKLGPLRVLGLVADKPEANPGPLLDPSTFRALHLDPPNRQPPPDRPLPTPHTAPKKVCIVPLRGDYKTVL